MRPQSFAGVYATVVGVGAVLFLTQASGTAQQKGASGRQKGGYEATGSYDVVPNWPQPLPDHGTEWMYGRSGAIWAESADRVYVVQTGDVPVP